MRRLVVAEGSTGKALARQAALDLQARLPELTDHDFETAGGGKMFGVLVVRDRSGAAGYLSAFSGQLDGAWQLNGFVPPVFDVDALASFWPAGEAELTAMTHQIENYADGHDVVSMHCDRAELEAARSKALAALAQRHQLQRDKRHRRRGELTLTDPEHAVLAKQSRQDKAERLAVRRRHDEAIVELVDRLDRNEAARVALVRKRAAQSKRLLQQIHDAYLLSDPRGTVRPLRSFFRSGEPPGGTGDCSAPKLLHYANRNGYHTLGLTEFWWGAPLATGDRRHGAYYSACAKKCGPIMSFLTGS